MASFDSNKIWNQEGSPNIFTPTLTELAAITKTIKLKFGGLAPPRTKFRLKDKIVFSRYKIVVIKDHLCILIKHLGEGVFGKVFKAYDTKSSKLVAIKAQPITHSDMIIKQAMITKDKGIGLVDYSVNIGPSFLPDNHGYFILPLADLDFYYWLKLKISSKEYNLIIKALIKIARDLISLHISRKVHMDLKMDNVLMVNDVAYLADFGKVEIEGACIPTAKQDYRNYPHCAPEFFDMVNSFSCYNVSPSFDIFSYGFLIEQTAKRIPDFKLALELKNIAKSSHTFNVCERIPLYRTIGYLESLLGKY